MAGLLAITSYANTLFSDFSSVRPFSFPDGGTSWANPVSQFQFFTNGGFSGQEVVPISGGNPTVSGGAGAGGFDLDLSGDSALQLTARLLPANQAIVIQVLLFDADGTIVRFDYPINNFNSSTFNTATANFSSATTVVAGSIPGFNWSDVTVYEVQGDFFDGGGTALFQAQFINLSGLGVPEPSSSALAAIGLICLVFARINRLRGI